MSGRVCLRCDWTGETDGATCPKCGAVLWQVPEPTTLREVTPAPRPQPQHTGDRVPSPPVETAQNDDGVPPAVPGAARGRWAVIVGAITVATVWIVATGVFDRFETPVVPGAVGTGPALDPFVSIQTQLDEQEAGDLFEVDTEDGTYWRMFALDLFDGSTWSSSGIRTGPSGASAPRRSRCLAPRATCRRAPSAASYEFRVLNEIATPWLPIPGRAETITVTGGEVAYDPFLARALVKRGLDEGFEYSVNAWAIVPTAEQLDVASVELLSPGQYGIWTSLPDSLDPRIEEIAARWTADATSDYRKVLAIQQHFHGGDFVYTTEVEARRRSRCVARVPHGDKSRLLLALRGRDGGNGAGARATGTYPGRVQIRDPEGGRQLPGSDR